MNSLEMILQKHTSNFFPILPFDLNDSKTVIFDFTSNNTELTQEILANTEKFTRYIFSALERNGALFGIGRYNENRTIYARSNLFGTQATARTIHLGIDLWTREGTSVYAPFEGHVHSFNDNAGYGDYGPTIILEHMLDGAQFYTLYGHLSRESLQGLHNGKVFHKEGIIGAVGDTKVNGSWPPHVHFQVIKTMGEKRGDFPGVTSQHERDFYLALCPNPNSILGIKTLAT